MRTLLFLLAMTGSAAAAEPAGPARAPAPRIAPAQAAMAKYRGDYGATAPAQPCPRGVAQGDVVVCGQPGRGGSPDRLPLPDERGAPAVRIATGDAGHVGVGGSPYHHDKAGTGLTLTVKPGKTSLTGNGQ